MMELTIGFSPCPNDTFIFDALVNGKIDTGGITFRPVLEDVQTLNQWAIDGKLDITKISYGVLPRVIQNYKLLESGGALGKGVGPLLVARNAVPDLGKAIGNMSIAIPGENTTANLLFSFAFPSAKQKQFMVFNTIENAVLNGEVDAGVIIHENRFTYQDKGLVKLKDLGSYWEDKTNAPIPLGGIMVKKNIDGKLQQEIDLLIRKSLEYGFERYPHLSPYIVRHSQEMSEDVMRKHIELYVNDFSLQLGKEGHAAVETFLKVYEQMNGIDIKREDIYREDVNPV